MVFLMFFALIRALIPLFIITVGIFIVRRFIKKLSDRNKKEYGRFFPSVLVGIVSGLSVYIMTKLERVELLSYEGLVNALTAVFFTLFLFLLSFLMFIVFEKNKKFYSPRKNKRL